jgi:pSer/pThr/pTyr-binding forkhead associated (FHA) protein
MDAKLVVSKGPARNRFVCLRNPETLVGRQRGCDVRIPSAEVSRRHCLLSFTQDGLTIEDLDSANGTFLNKQRVTQRQTVRPGDELTVGPLTFTVQFAGAPGAEARPETADPAAAEEGFQPAFELLEEAPRPANGPIPFKAAENGEELELEFGDSDPLDLPQGGDLRDFLSKMDR